MKINEVVKNLILEDASSWSVYFFTKSTIGFVVNRKMKTISANVET